jgi:hypothetical protein
MVGNATFTTDSSTNAIVDPSTAATSTQGPVEGDRGCVPIEHRPIEPRAAALERRVREPREQAPADAAPARVRTDEQVLEVDAGLADEGREVVEEEGEADRGTLEAGEHDLGVGARTAERRGEIRRGGGHLVLQALIHRQLADEFQHQRHFVGGGRADGDDVGHGVSRCSAAPGRCRPRSRAAP